MRPQPDLSIVIPAFNEEARLGADAGGLPRVLPPDRAQVEVIVVDDGSLDQNQHGGQCLRGEHPEVRLIRLAENQGKGQAVRSGVVNAQGSGSSLPMPTAPRRCPRSNGSRPRSRPART